MYYSIDDGYGDNITETRGAFFSLSEGWADYIGHTYAFIKYGTNLNTVTEINAWTSDTLTGNYRYILEEVPTFYNSFIPRGLFFDLTDANTTQEQAFDRISGHTTNDIYQTISPSVITIQDFRVQWLNQRTNATTRLIHQILFNRYNVN